MYSQVKDITRLGDRTCRKCNNEIMEKLSAIYRNQLLVFYNSVCSC